MGSLRHTQESSSLRRSILRACFFVVMVLSLLWLPWWVTITIAVIDAFLLGGWPEVLLLAFMVDIAYGPRSVFVGAFRHTLWAAGLGIVSFLVRRQTRVMYGFS